MGLFELVALRESKNGGSVSDEGGVMSCPACGQRFCEDIGWIVLGGYPFGSNLRIFEDIVLHKHFFVRDVTGPVAICCALRDVDCDLIVHLEFGCLTLSESGFV